MDRYEVQVKAYNDDETTWSKSKNFVTLSEDPAAITTIYSDKVDNVDNRIFDLQGRDLQGVPEAGIYIKNGKKYVK